MNASGPVLVVGGTGRTGRHVVRKLLERGYPARVLTRHPARVENLLGDGVGVFGGDVTDAESVRLEQGDTGEGRVPREDVAEVCVGALTHEEARGKTFEVYGEPGPPPGDWGAAFASLSPDRPK